ncbi:MAG: bifunctional protein-serine/threonine kinase/phosphatase, partial [Marinobacter sp.]|nr:bifunctional protein-serine/threonine kinase/phosphatase [Marinobacter sp.]
MTRQLHVAIGQYSHPGRKAINQDFHGAVVPPEPQLSAKGVAIALADGISSSDVSQIASQAAVTSFLEDYFCTSEAWSVKKSAQQVMIATNSWLHSQTRNSEFRYDRDRGYVCTLSAMVIKSRAAHLFHVGDSRIYRLRDREFEQLTHDHRLWISEEKSYLSRAMGASPHPEIDYQSVPVEEGDVFILTTDGVHEFISRDDLIARLESAGDDLDAVARQIVEQAYANGSDDNLTIQLLRINQVPDQTTQALYNALHELPLPPILEARQTFDGYTIVRELHATSRSHVYLANDHETGEAVVLKTPSIDLRGDSAYLERFMMEEWIARRLNSPHVLKPCAQTRKRHFLYIATEYIDGQTLAQWMIDNPRPDLATVRGMVAQIARGLRAFHRLEMLHQDLRPANVMIDRSGTLKIIDFGSTRVAGLSELLPDGTVDTLLGTAQYTAPEYFLGEAGSPRSDLFSLGVITYQMLTGRLPYGAEVAKARTRSTQRRLTYQSALSDDREIPAWVDDVL